jgi:inhibitor of cysteine peptidase
MTIMGILGSIFYLTCAHFFYSTFEKYYNSHLWNYVPSLHVYRENTDKRKGRARMFTKITLTIAILILLVSLASCGASTPTQSTSNTNENSSPSGPSGTPTENDIAENYTMLPILSGKMANVSLDATADGSTQQLNKGEVLSITLESNPSTGYGWFATISSPTVLVQMGEPQYLEPTSSSGSPLPGATGTQTFNFQATETGSTTLTLDYKRGWETNVTPEKSITITVEVK